MIHVGAPQFLTIYESLCASLEKKTFGERNTLYIFSDKLPAWTACNADFWIKEHSFREV